MISHILYRLSSHFKFLLIRNCLFSDSFRMHLLMAYHHHGCQLKVRLQKWHLEWNGGGVKGQNIFFMYRIISCACLNPTQRWRSSVSPSDIGSCASRRWFSRPRNHHSSGAHIIPWLSNGRQLFSAPPGALYITMCHYHNSTNNYHMTEGTNVPRLCLKSRFSWYITCTLTEVTNRFLTLLNDQSQVIYMESLR